MPIPKLYFDGPKKSKKFVVLTHGAGASSDSAFLTYFAEELAKLRYRVVRFDFPYMEQRSVDGRKRPPNTEETLCAAYMEVIKYLREDRNADKMVIGGKSMGGRIASLIADEAQVQALLCLGYPFHPTGKPEKTRTEHLADLQTPTLLIQGERDPFGSREEVVDYKLSKRIKLHWVPDGDHSYKTNRHSDRVTNENMGNALRHMIRFLFEVWPE